jgi:hypothetical protein
MKPVAAHMPVARRLRPARSETPGPLGITTNNQRMREHRD